MNIPSVSQCLYSVLVERAPVVDCDPWGQATEGLPAEGWHVEDVLSSLQSPGHLAAGVLPPQHLAGWQLLAAKVVRPARCLDKRGCHLGGLP